ncbi:alanine racemase [Bacteroidota bacterium]
MIRKPSLLIDEKKCRENIRWMFSKAQKANVDFRPHFKTHQSLEIGRWFKEAGIDKITVSSLEMAEYFSSEWDDITVAFPVNILEIDGINDLAVKINLNLLIESAETASFLRDNMKSRAGFFIKIDVGNHRTGIIPSNTQGINDILAVSDSAESMDFQGFLGHAGHTYNCNTREKILEIHKESLDIMAGLKLNFIDRYPNLILSLGDTPGCSVSEDFSGIDEIRPGNFVFYDLTQNKIGSSNIEKIAVAMACPIVAIHRNRGEIVIYGGGVHFSKERLEDEKEGTIYGKVVEKSDKGWGNIIQGMYLKSLSQEHGILSVPDSEITKYSVGDTVLILPVHSCMTANLMKDYQTTGGHYISKR